MARKLAGLIFTEEDKVNCPFYHKIGACRHGDRCTRQHHKPVVSSTLLLRHLYENPAVSVAISEGSAVPEEAVREAVRHFENFYEEVWLNLMKFGEILDIIVVDNMGDHMIGHVFIKFGTEEEAELAARSLTGRFYAGKNIVVEYSPVLDFTDARCRQHETAECNRGAYCNFMHVKHISSSFKKSLKRQMYYEYPEYRQRRKERKKEEQKHKRKRSRSREKDRRKDKRDPKERGGKERVDKERSRDHKDRQKDAYNKRQNSQERRDMIHKWNIQKGFM